MVNRTTITVSSEVHSKLKEIKEKIGVPNIDLVLRWLLKMPPFSNKKNDNKKYKKEENKTKSTETVEYSYYDRLKQAVKYVNKIIREEGKISEEKLRKVLIKFNISEEDLLREANLIMKETGEYYPM